MKNLNWQPPDLHICPVSVEFRAKQLKLSISSVDLHKVDLATIHWDHTKITFYYQKCVYLT